MSSQRSTQGVGLAEGLCRNRKCSAYGCIIYPCIFIWGFQTHRIHGAAIYGNMDPINIPKKNVSIYTSTMDPMGNNHDHAKNVQTYVIMLGNCHRDLPQIHLQFMGWFSMPSWILIWLVVLIHPKKISGISPNHVFWKKCIFKNKRYMYMCVCVRIIFYYHYCYYY